MRITASTRRAAAAVTAALLLAGCSGGNPEQTSSPQTAQTQSAAKSWLLAMEQGSSSSSAGSRLYVLLDLDTGKTEQIPLPEGADVDADPGDVLQVSADFRYAIMSSTLSDQDRESATLQLYPLAQAQQPVTLDLRASTKQMDLAPIAAAFDPTDASKLRVVTDDGSIWSINTENRNASKEPTRVLGAVDSSTSIAFDPRTGAPYIVSPTGPTRFKGWPQPGGEMLTEAGTYPSLPAGKGVVFKRSTGEVWAFQVQGSAFRIYKIQAGAQSWSPVTVQPTPPIPAGDGVHVDWARPPGVVVR